MFRSGLALLLVSFGEVGQAADARGVTVAAHRRRTESRPFWIPFWASRRLKMFSLDMHARGGSSPSAG